MTLTKSLLRLFLFPFVSAALVAPPTNVTLTCRSQQNILKWDYDNIVPGLRFKVSIFSDSSLNSCHNEIWDDQPSLQANLSFLSEPDSLYYVTVTAVLGENQSVSDGLEFTYFHSSPRGQICVLDFPPVNVTPLENYHIQLQFDHPWLLYKEGASVCEKHKKKKKHLEGNNLPPFGYTVKLVGQDKTHNFVCEDAVCKNKLQVDLAQDKHCLKIEGLLEKMSVESTKKFCTQKAPPPLNRIALSIGISIAVVAALALIGIMVCWKKTTPFLAIPDTLKKFSKGKTHFEPLSDQPSPVVISPVEQDEVSLSLVDPVDVNPPSGSTGYDLRNQVLSEDPEEGDTTGDPYTGGQTLGGDEPEAEDEPEADEGSRSAYEKRSVVELAPEDHAEGYRG